MTQSTQEHIKEIIKLIETSFANRWIIDKTYTEQELFITVKKEYIAQVLAFLKENKKSGFCSLIDITAIDSPKQKKRFTVIYHLLNPYLAIRARIKTQTDSDNSISSVSNIFSSASWLEREVWDMFGISFIGNENLCRIINEQNFSWFPLRKSFPLEGFLRLSWDNDKEECLYSALKKES